MDALKKAEMAKRQSAADSAREPFKLAEDNAANPLSGLSLEPVSPAVISAPAPSTLDAATNDDGHTDAQKVMPATRFSDAENFGLAALSSQTAPAPKPAPVKSGKGTNQDSPKLNPDQRSAQNLFQAKHADGPATANEKPVFAIAVGSATLLAMVVIGGYFWWQLQPRSSVGPALPAGAPLPVAKPAITPAAPLAVAPPPAAVVAPIVPTASMLEPTDAETGDEQSSSATISPPKRVARVSAERRDTMPDDERQIRITTSPMRVNPGLRQGFDAAQRGDWSTAQSAYASVLVTDAHNADALHGLANIAMRQNKPADAERYLQRLLLANPQDAGASAALANLYARAQPVQAEAKLKALAQAQPELADASIALGNLYAGQERWAEAQQAYFTAYASQPGNPDLLFNLAISLEYLNQPKLAMQYYAEALQASKRWPATFTTSQVEERLRALHP